MNSLMQISNNKIFDNELCFTTGIAKMLNQIMNKIGKIKTENFENLKKKLISLIE